MRSRMKRKLSSTAVSHSIRKSDVLGRPTQQLRQLGEVHRYPPRLVARQPIGRRAVRRSNMSGIGGEAEVRGLRLNDVDDLTGSHQSGVPVAATAKTDKAESLRLHVRTAMIDKEIGTWPAQAMGDAYLLPSIAAVVTEAGRQIIYGAVIILRRRARGCR
jgi:hypothetical protein